jgi:AraC-like DNA-binding protein
MDNKWKPPFFLFNAGRMRVADKSYRNDSRYCMGPPRILVKRTLSGTGVVYVHGKRFLIPPGYAMFIERPGDNVYCHEELSEPWHFEYVSMVFRNPTGLLPRDFADNPVFDLRDQPDLMRRLTELIDICHTPNYQPVLAHSALAYSFFLSYITVRSELNLDKPPETIIKLRKILESELSVPVELDKLADRYKCRPETLIRKFSACYGVTPVRFRTQVRLRHACRLLVETGLSIKEIALECGFDSQEYFSRQFRKYIKITPGGYRANPDPLLMTGLQL